MKVTGSLAAFLTGISVVAANSGIFNDQGDVKSAPSIIEGVQVVPRASGNAIYETNADRLRRGLSPLPPTRRSHRLAPRASSTPGSPLTSTQGIIEVTKVSTAAVIGYMSKTFDGQNSYTYGPISSALTVALPSLTPFGTPIGLTAIGGPDASHPYVGAVGGSGGYYFGPGSSGYAYLAGTGYTAANSPPSSSAGTSIQTLGYNGPSESKIWTLNSSTFKLTAQWTNTDGTQKPTLVMYDPSVDFLGLAGDLGAFGAAFPGESAFEVTLKFISA